MIYDEDENFQGDFLASQVKHWPKTGNEVLIPYTKTEFADAEKEEALERAISEFNTKTCIRYSDFF